MDSSEIRKRFLTFFEKRGHAILPSAPLVPVNDPSVLFNTAGMQPLVPYLLGQEHPQGKRLADIQKCVRTNDIDEVGDNTHLTFFEMMGNWSLGDYWKKESINWSYELLTSKEEGFGLDPQRLYITCFEGDENAPKDEESAQIWKEIFEKNGVTGERIYFRPKEKNWWSAGPNGPCGPDTEMFYDLTGELTNGQNLKEYLKADDEQRVVEIWNNVFMQYLSRDGKVVSELPNKNVDTGAGFERMVVVVQGKSSVFETDIFSEFISSLPEKYNERNKRILADHIRTSAFLISEGIRPGNKDQGYVLRKLIRRVLSQFELEDVKTAEKWVVSKYNSELEGKGIFEVIEAEWKQFGVALESGRKELNKISEITPEIALTLYASYGLSFEVIKDKFPELSKKEFDEQLKKHQEISKQGSDQKFKGGLSGTGEMETKYHTATHLLHQALRDVLGDSVQQKGSNITSERLRFDFAFDRKMTDEEKKKVEDIVNEKIEAKLPMQKIVMKKEEAEKTGALHFFGDKYGDEVSIYFIGENLENAYSKEFCGGPHVENTGTLGKFKIVKEEAVSAGVRRIKAMLE